MNNSKKIVLSILVLLLAIPPFFSGGNNVFIRGMIFVLAGLAGVLFCVASQNSVKVVGDLNPLTSPFKKGDNTAPLVKGGEGGLGRFVQFQNPLIFLFLYLLFGLISIFFSVSPYHSAALWLECLSYAVLFLVAAKIKLEKKEIDWLIKIFLGVSAILCLMGIYFYIVGSYSRLTSLFWWPNPFAGYLLFALFLGLEWVLNSNGHQNDDFVSGTISPTLRPPLARGGIYLDGFLRRGILPILFLSIIFSSFILTGSRGAFLSFLIVLPVYFWLKFLKSPQPPLLKGGQPSSPYEGGGLGEVPAQVALTTPPPLRPSLSRRGIIGGNFIRIAAIILLSIFLVFIINFFKNDSFSFVNHIKQSGTEQDFSSGIRLKYWQGAWEMFKEKPITGWGAGTFGTVYQLYQKDAISAGKYAHNLYLEILGEQGIFTAIFFILFLVAVLFKILKPPYIPLYKGEIIIPPLQRGDRGVYSLGESGYALPLFAGTLAFLIHNGVDVDWHFSANAIVFWVFLGVLYNINREEVLPREHLGERSRKTLLIFISIILIFSGLALLRGNYFYEKGNNLKNNGDLAEAEIAFQKSVFLNPNPDYLKELGIILYSRALNANNVEREILLNKSLEISKKIIKHDSYNSLNYELGGRIYLTQGNLEEAEKNFSEAVRLDKFNPTHYINLVSLLISEGRKDEARDLINKILSFYPEEVVANRKAYIMANQEITSGIEKEIEYLRYLLGVADNK